MLSFSKLGLHGGFGNQFYQFASLYTIGRLREVEIKIPRHKSYFHEGYQMMSHYIGDYFDLPATILTGREEYMYQYLEKDLHFDPQFHSIPDKTDILGYFQSEKYFLPYQNDVRAIFSPSEKYRRIIDDFFNTRRLDPHECAGIHVRRKDYLKKQEYHPVLPVQYYSSAVAALNPAKILIASDDIDWCRENLQFEQEMFLIESGDDIADFFILSACVKFAIANSTYSWWAAWLQNNPAKIVACPAVWFGEKYGNAHLDSLYPETWRRISF